MSTNSCTTENVYLQGKMCIQSAKRANGTAASPRQGYDFMIAITEHSIHARNVGLSLEITTRKDSVITNRPKITHSIAINVNAISLLTKHLLKNSHHICLCVQDRTGIWCWLVLRRQGNRNIR